MSAETLLSRLQRVRKTGAGRWVASCPSHDSASKSSLAIRELPDGRVLVHDFGGCSVGDVLGAVGLDFEVLFPERIDIGPESRGDRRYRSRTTAPYPAADVLRAVVDDMVIAATVLRDVCEARAANDEQVGRLFTIAGRMARAAELANAP